MDASADERESGHQPERRVHHRVRAVFSEACALIAPLLADLGGTISGYGLAQIMRNRYPELTDTELHVLIAATTNHLQGRT